MPSMANIAVNDGKGTPQTHTFGPDTTNGAKADFINRSFTLYSGAETVTINYVKPSRSNGGHIYELTTKVPIVESVNGINTVTRYSLAKTTFTSSGSSSTAELTDLVAMHINLLNNATVKAAIIAREPWY